MSDSKALGVVFLTSIAVTAGPSDRGGSSLVRHVKCLTFFVHRIFDVENKMDVKKGRSGRHI